MRIGQIIINYYPIESGAELFCREISERLSKNRDIVIDVITRNVSNFNPNYINNVQLQKVFPRIKSVQDANKRYKTYLFTLTSVQKLIQGNYHIIHSHAAAAGMACRIYKLLRKQKYVSTVQGGDLADYDETTRNRYFEKGVRSYIENAEVVHAVSNYAKEKAINLGANNVVVIPNGTDSNIYKPKTPNKNLINLLKLHNCKVAITTSRLVKSNGVDILIKAFSILKNDNYKLLVLGTGPDLKIMQKLANKNVLFLGWIPREQIVEYLNLADVFIRTSRAEGFGISFIEAMSCGKPIIGTKVGGITDFLYHNKNGLFCDINSIEDISQKIEYLFTNDKLSNQLGKRGRNDVLRKFNWDKITKQILDLYKSIY